MQYLRISAKTFYNIRLDSSTQFFWIPADSGENKIIKIFSCAGSVCSRTCRCNNFSSWLAVRNVYARARGKLRRYRRLFLYELIFSPSSYTHIFHTTSTATLLSSNTSHPYVCSSSSLKSLLAGIWLIYRE